MKKLLVLSVALSTAALASTAFGARFYAQPSVAVTDAADFDSAAGPALALGATFADKHSVEIEGAMFDTHFQSRSEYKMKLAPVTLNYRYEFPISGKWSGSTGLSLGVVRQEADFTLRVPGPPPYYPAVTARWDETDDSFAAGFHTGIAYRMNDHFALTLNAKVLVVDASDLIRRSNMLTLQLGLNCRL